MDFNWIWSKVQKIYKEQGNTEVKKHIITAFMRRNHLEHRRIQRNKKQSKEDFWEKLIKWHTTLRKHLICTGKDDAQYDEKWGYFKPKQCLNVDQSPLPFSYECKKTYEVSQKDQKVWVRQSNANSGKRFCSHNICFRPEGDQSTMNFNYFPCTRYLHIFHWQRNLGWKSWCLPSNQCMGRYFFLC